MSIRTIEHKKYLTKNDDGSTNGFLVPLTQNIVGMEFESQINGKNTFHKITGFKTANRKYPIITKEKTTEGSYKFDVQTIKSKLGGEKLINRVGNLNKLLG